MSRRSCAFILIAFSMVWHGHRSAEAQLPQLSQQTLDLRDVTATQVQQTVAEGDSGNEKWIELGDYDNDGDLDAVMSVVRSDFGQRRNKLYRNDNGMLVEVSGAPVIPGFSFLDTSRSAFLRDFDSDGFLDIAVVNSALSGTATNDSPGTTKYFRNVDGQSFVNESQRLDGLRGAAENAVAADFDGNGFCDLYLCNTVNISQDTMALNNLDGNSPGQFEVVTLTHVPAENRNGKHVEAADMNGDGQIDLLVANSSGTVSFIYYNNNLGLGAGAGDFRYDSPSSASQFEEGGPLGERVLVPGDFNNDGRMDLYFSNRLIQGADRIDCILQNVGNDEFNRAVFKPVAIPAIEDSETMKVTVTDLNLDGRLDLIVMSEFRRPQVLRNVSENGEISFLGWTPPAITSLHTGWHAASADVLGNERPDVFVGAMQDDFLFENVTSQILEADDLVGGVLPSFHQVAPIAVTGTLQFGDTSSFIAADLPIGARVSVLLRSLGDVSLVVRQNGTVLAQSNQPGHGSDEAVAFQVADAGPISFELTLEALSFDGNGDQVVNLLDIESFVDCLTGASADCDPFDLNDDGQLNLTLVDPFIEKLTSGIASEGFVIEYLSRTE